MPTIVRQISILFYTETIVMPISLSKTITAKSYLYLSYLFLHPIYYIPLTGKTFYLSFALNSIYYNIFFLLFLKNVFYHFQILNFQLSLSTLLYAKRTLLLWSVLSYFFFVWMNNHFDFLTNSIKLPALLNIFPMQAQAGRDRRFLCPYNQSL